MMMTAWTDFSVAVLELATEAARLSLFIKVSWMLLLVWAMLQTIWYRKARVDASLAVAEKPKAPRRARAPRKKASPSVRAARPVMAALDPEPQAVTVGADSVYR